MIYGLLFDDKGNKTLEFRNEQSEKYQRRQSPPFRTSYNVIGRDLVRQSKSTTYRVVSDIAMHTSVMGVNRKIYEETSYMLYSTHSFSFDRDIEAIAPFFGDLRVETRPFVHEISLLKQGFVYSRDYDRCEWKEVCNFLKDNMQLSSLKLVVEGGRPSRGWDGFPLFSAGDFRTMSKLRHEPLEWVWELLAIEGIRNLEIGSEIHHCPPTHSNGMQFFAAFSASIEDGFTDFLRAELVRVRSE